MSAAPRESETVVVVGAGLVGSLLALFLAKRGHHVELYERRPDMRREAISAGRSINLALSVRGIHALRQVGLEREVLAQAIPMRGRMIHQNAHLGAAQTRPPGTKDPSQLAFQPYGKSEDECINSVSRGALNQLLMTHAEKTGRCRIHFNQRAVAVDFRSRELEFRDERSHESRKVRYDRVIGTDGSASAIRSEMIRLPGYDFSQEYLAHGYKELTIPPGAGGSFQLEKHALHIWPRRDFMLIALPNPDASFTCTLFLPHEGPVSFASLRAPEDVERFFATEFGDARARMPKLTEEFFGNPTGYMVTTRCAPWNVGGEVLLLGDAAHAIVPFFGQGMNCGFEDCSVLEQLLGESGEDWNRIFTEFSRTRKPDSDAIAAMALENFVEMRDKVGNPRFMLEKQVEMALQKKFPERYVSRYGMVTFTRLPYRQALEAGKVQDEILAELCRDLAQAAEVDLAAAERMIAARLSPLGSR